MKSSSLVRLPIDICRALFKQTAGTCATELLFIPRLFFPWPGHHPIKQCLLMMILKATTQQGTGNESLGWIAFPCFDKCPFASLCTPSRNICRHLIVPKSLDKASGAHRCFSLFLIQGRREMWQDATVPLWDLGRFPNRKEINITRERISKAIVLVKKTYR